MWVDGVSAMRLMSVGLAIVLLGVFFVPITPDASACRISVRHPTDPYWSDDCTNPPYDQQGIAKTAEVDQNDVPGPEDAPEPVSQVIEECPVSAVDCEVVFGAHLEGSVNDDDSEGRLNVSAEAWTGGQSYAVSLAQ